MMAIGDIHRNLHLNVGGYFISLVTVELEVTAVSVNTPCFKRTINVSVHTYGKMMRMCM